MFSFSSVSCQQKRSQNQQTKLSDDSLFKLVQYKTFQYFWNGAEPTSGAARERYHEDNNYPDNDKNIVTTGGTGFGVMAILVGIERGFITRKEGEERLTKLVSWLSKADRFHGAWPHWMNGETGKVKPFGANDNGGDLVETAFLVQGLLCVRQYFQDGNSSEKMLAQKIDSLWKGVEWDWYRRGNQNVLYWHWSPDKQWIMNHQLQGYDETLVTYFLAAASPTHSIPAEVYHQGWARKGGIRNEEKHEQYGMHLALKHNGQPQFGGPLFWSHYSFLGLDPRHLKDDYADYWEHNKNHVMIDYRYCVQNPKGYKGYGPNCWGLTAGYSVNFYAAHSPANDLGVINPTAALASYPYSPEESKAAMRYFYDSLGSKIFGEFGFYDGFSEQFDWYKPWYLAIDQGPIVVMMENYRSGLLWKLFMSAPEVQVAKIKLGFK
ncbi:MAG TPA: beta-glucosidase [Cytophagales bacterium]|nr:beta-glucosidase [Cytophagales bacterium]